MPCGGKPPCTVRVVPQHGAHETTQDLFPQGKCILLLAFDYLFYSIFNYIKRSHVKYKKLSQCKDDLNQNDVIDQVQKHNLASSQEKFNKAYIKTLQLHFCSSSYERRHFKAKPVQLLARFKQSWPIIIKRFGLCLCLLCVADVVYSYVPVDPMCYHSTQRTVQMQGVQFVSRGVDRHSSSHYWWDCSNIETVIIYYQKYY